SGLAMANGYLYAALGSISGDANNGVYRTQILSSASPNFNTPAWYVGDPTYNQGSGWKFGVDNERPTQFPTYGGSATLASLTRGRLTGGQQVGNMKLTAASPASGGNIYASVATKNGTLFALLVQQNTTGIVGQVGWSNRSPGNYMSTQGGQPQGGNYDNAIWV